MSDPSPLTLEDAEDRARALGACRCGEPLRVQIDRFGHGNWVLRADPADRRDYFVAVCPKGGIRSGDHRREILGPRTS